MKLAVSFHFASAAGLLHAGYRTPGDEYSLIFKLTDALLHDHSAKEELFRRVTLNVLEHNRDDHLKNFGFLMDAEGHWCSHRSTTSPTATVPTAGRRCLSLAKAKTPRKPISIA